MPRPQPSDAGIGDRVATRRKLLGYSVRHAADRAGLSPSTWSRIERGLVGADNRFTLAKLAEALRCSVLDLTGQPTAPTDRASAEGASAAYETIRAAIESDLRYGPTVAGGPVQAVVRELELVTGLRTKGDYIGALGRLPGLIRGAYAATRGTDRPEALRSLVLVSDTASFAIRYAGDPPGACLVADRARQAAEVLEDPVMLGLSAWSQAHGATGCGLYARALTIADAAAAELRPRLKSPAAPEMYGALLLLAAFSAAALGDTAEVEARVAEAEQLAARTGDSDALQLSFGPTNVRLWQVAMEVDGGDPGRAVEIARETNALAIPRVERRASFYADTGRALTRIGRDQEAVRMLATAERLAPQRIRNSPLVAETVRSLLDRAQRNAAGAELRGLCERLGVLA